MVGWLKNLFGRASPKQLGRYIRWAGADWDTGGEVTSGVSVSEETALNYAACWCATRVIAESIASLPALVYRRLPNDRGRERSPDHPLYDVLHTRPNPQMTAFAFHETMACSLINWGNAYAEVLWKKSGVVNELWPLHPSRVRPYRADNGSIRYEVRDDVGLARTLDAEGIVHIAGALSDNGITGRGIIRQARESIGMGLATEQYGAGFFGNGARPGGVLSHPANPTPDAEANMRASWEAMHRGPKNSSRTALLREGTTYTPIGIPPEDAQFLQTRQFNVTEIARWYRIAPHKLMDLTRATFSNIEQQAQDFYADSVVPWLRRMEMAYMFRLLEPGSEYYIEFLVDGALRGDSVARTQAAVQQFLNGALTLNEWRAMENRNAIDGEGGDAHFVPLNLVPIERAMEEPEPPPAPVIETQPQDEEPEEDRQPPASEQQQRAAMATKAVIDYELGRLRTKEINAVRRAANTPSDFLSKVESFYARHREHMVDALLPAVTAHLAAVEIDADPVAHTSRLVDKRCEIALAAVLKAAECPARQLPEAIRELTQTWETKEADHAETQRAA